MGIINRLSIEPFAIISHRTAAGIKPENSLSGISYSINIGADIVEVDVRKTRDGVLVLFHDEDLKRLFNIDRKLRELSYEWLVKNGIFDNGETIPTLDEALTVLRGKTGLFLEVKEPDTTREIIETVIEHGNTGDTAIISFYDEALKEAKQIVREMVTGLIYFKPPGRIFDAKKLGAEIVLPHYRIATLKANQLAHKLKLKVAVWTINDENKAIEAVHRGADGVASDYPAQLIALRERLEGLRTT